MEQKTVTPHRLPLVSIIIATYNAEGYLPGCLESIREHATGKVEIIIIDGASTDDTVSVIREYADLPIKLRSEPDKGIYDAFNKGLQLAVANWCLFLGADDRLLVGFKEILKNLKDQDALYYTDIIVLGKRFGKRYSKYNLAKQMYCHQGIFYPTQIIQYFGYSEMYPVFADYELNIKCWGLAALRKIYLGIPIVDYNPDGFSATAEDKQFKADKPALIKKHLGLIVYLRYLFRKFKESRNPESKFF